MESITKTEKDTLDLGKQFARSITPGTTLLLHGDLGAGKSVFIRGVLRGLGVSEAIPSPTFALVNEYNGTLPSSGETVSIFHFDLYRINDPYELYEIGFEEYVYSDGISCIEWPGNAGDLLPSAAINITIAFTDHGRKITIDNNPKKDNQHASQHRTGSI